MSCDDRAWHAGASRWHERPSCNDYSIGIELEGTDETPYEEAQYVALVRLVRVLLATYPALGHDRNPWAERNGGAQAGVKVVIAEGLLEDRERGFARAMHRSNPVDFQCVMKRGGDAAGLVVLRRQQMQTADDQVNRLCLL